MWCIKGWVGFGKKVCFFLIIVLNIVKIVVIFKCIDLKVVFFCFCIYSDIFSWICNFLL